jgi:plastocyanin
MLFSTARNMVPFGRKMRRAAWFWPALLLAGAWLSTNDLHGATNIVYLDNSEFQPNDLTIQAGDTVEFITRQDAHRVLPGPGSGEAYCGYDQYRNENQICRKVFSAVGTFPVKCYYHGDFGMTGVIRVVAATNANLAPTVVLVAPTNNATVSTAAPIIFTASAADSDGTVKEVAFFAGPNFLSLTNNLGAVTNGTNGTFTLQYTNQLETGTYNVVARAKDNLNAEGFSLPISITVVTNIPPTITLLSPTNNGTVATNYAVFQVSASDTDGTLKEVAFLIGPNATELTNTLGVVTNATNGTVTLVYTNGLDAGSIFFFAARVVDNLNTTNFSTTNSFTTISNATPTVSLLSPTNNESVAGVPVVTFQASAADSDGTIKEVTFFVGTNSLALTNSFGTVSNGTNGTFTLLYTNGLDIGPYFFTAQALDNLNVPAASGTNSFFVNALLVAPVLTNGVFEFTVNRVQIGQQFILEGSTTLTNWTPIQTNMASSSTLIFSDTNNVANPFFFFRLRRL